MNQKIAIIADNSRKYVEKLLNIWGDKNCAVLIDWRIPWEKIEEMLELADVKFCYVDRHISDNMQNTKFKYEIIEHENSIETVEKDYYKSYVPNYSTEDALILFSSGTTGTAKGIVLSFRALEINSNMVIEYMNLNKTDSIYLIKSLAHSSTVVCELLVAIKMQMQIYVAPTIMPMRFTINNILNYKITVICVNPILLSLFCNYIEKKGIYIECLKTIYTSGSILPDELRNKAIRLLKNTSLCNVYGLTECGPRVSAQTPDRRWNSNSNGNALSGVKIKIKDKNGNKLKNSLLGVIWINTPALFTRYLNADKKLDEDGFFCTNDIGYLENDELYIVGRSDNMIISGAHNIYPETIEKVINNVPGIEFNVIISVKDETYGEKLVCLYRANKEMEIELKQACMSQVATYEVPHIFIKVESLPRNNNGKILRNIVKQQYLEMIGKNV